MNVAFPINHQIIAATFDFATQLLVVTYRNKKILNKTIVDIDEPLPSLRAARLKRLHIDILICGAISNPLATMVWHLNINIISGISGDVEIVLKEFLHSSNNLFHYTLPGFTGKHWKGCCKRNQIKIKKLKK